MESQKQAIEVFFKAYEKRFNDSLTGKEADIDGTTDAFAECFIEANPAGVICNENDEKFKKAMRKGYAFYKKIGIQSMAIVSQDITVLDEMYAIVKIHWRAGYIKKDKSKVAIEFDVQYFLQIREGKIKIFAYITGDEQKALKENGLI